jgi:hypothetical protein
MRLKPKHFFDIFLILFFAFVIITALGYNFKARLIPLVVALPCLAMAIYRFAVDLKGKEKEGLSGEDELLKDIMDKVDVTVDHKEKKEKISSEEKKRRFFNMAVWILGFVVLIFLFGFLIAIPVFTLLFMRYHKESWILSLSCAVGLCVSVYIAFVVIAKTILYEGLIFKFFAG